MYKQDDRTLPAYAGLATFLRAPAVAPDEVAEGALAVVGVPFDGASGARPGARYGPHAIRYSSLHLHYYVSSSPGAVMFDLETGERLEPGPLTGAGRLVDVGDVSVYPSSTERTAASVTSAVREIAGRGARVMVLGGDHYVTYPAVRGVVEGLAQRARIAPEDVRLGYVQIDAHFDLASDNALYGSHFHGATARLVAALPAVGHSRMAWIGQRGFVRGEQLAYVKDNGLLYFTPSDIRRRGPVEVAHEVLSRVAAGTHGVYVTIDIDVVDVTEAPGTGAISFGGLTAGEFQALVAAFRDKRVVGLDLMEVAPDFDPSERTQRLAALALLRFVTDPS